MVDKPRADVRVGYLCNNNCRFCCVADQRSINLTTEEIKKELEIAKRNGAQKVVFTGGEPTIRKDVFETISNAKELGFEEIVVITNGRMCSYEHFVGKLVSSGLTGLCFSFPDHRENIYDHLTQVRGGWEHLQKAIENAEKHSLEVSTITVIHKLNYKELPKITHELIVMSKAFKNFFSEFVFINPTDNAWRHRDELVPKISETAPHIHKALDLSLRHGLILNVEAVPFCYMRGYEKHVVELHMAEERVFVDPDGVDQDYNENRRLLGKFKRMECSSCLYDEACEGVWKNYEQIHGSDELRPVPTPQVEGNRVELVGNYKFTYRDKELVSIRPKEGRPILKPA